MPMRILLLGNKGQLGWELQRTLATLGTLNACDYPEVDLADFDRLRLVIRECRPDVLINAAAYTAVDRAESEPDLAQAVNASAPAVLAEEAAHTGSAFIHFSTDYVFDGLKNSPYLETDMPNPLSVYGCTKLSGEQAVEKVGGAYLVLRTSWVYSLRGDSFVTKVLRWARGSSPLRLVTDQISGPTWARVLAEVTTQLITLGRDDLYAWFSHYHGLYHLAGSGYCSRLEWGREVMLLEPHREQQTVSEVQPAQTSEFPTPARRPLFSALNCDHFINTFNLQLPDWHHALKLAMEAA
jgi:dTDP-4-dehydrorhamnose reductase